MSSNLSTLTLTLEVASKAVNGLSDFGNIINVSPYLAPLGLAYLSPQASLELSKPTGCLRTCLWALQHLGDAFAGRTSSRPASLFESVSTIRTLVSLVASAV